MRIIMVAICLYMLWGHSANAQSKTSLPIAEVSADQSKKLTLDLDLSVDSNLRDSSDPDFESNSYIDISATYRAFKMATVSVRTILEQKLYADQETALSNTTLTVKRDPIDLTDTRALTLSTFSILPTNETDRLDNTYRGGLGLATGVSQKYSVLKKSGSLGYTISYLQNFHEFSRTNEYSTNLENRIRHIVTVSQKVSNKVSLSILGRYQTAWTYQDALKTSFLLSEELSYEIGDSGQVYFAHANGGDALRANGSDSNVSIYDESASTLSSGIRVQF